ncbi:shieldin complex subunit 3 isoform X2 [Amphiprion ocellaris]|uniref:shieldin complex subunit 3 isoform X2 n=1 Tax=Amphiprion ocellaris TaxID=80972 RepID=UPI002410C0EC|nr:shieldin complex subunit 3 isoform X2 [Amphiprion ocellaris]
MEDVVLHYRSGSAEGLQTLLETSEKLLELFPCRPPPVFTCWFPAAADRLPIRPVKPAPVITSSDASISKPLLGNQSESRTADGVSEEQTSPVRRSWSVFRQTEVLLQSSQSMSRRFLHMVSLHKLHLRQRAKWVIREKNWETRDIEQVWRILIVWFWSLQVWRTLTVWFWSLQVWRILIVWFWSLQVWRILIVWFWSLQVWRILIVWFWSLQVWRTLIRSVRSSGLPSFNANIQRQRAEIWVFCDVLNGEQVGRHLKEQLQLKGRISLTVRHLGNIFSL